MASPQVLLLRPGECARLPPPRSRGMNRRLVLAVLPLLALPTLVAAQAAAAPASLNAPAGRRIEVPEGTEVVAVFTQALSSKTSAAGDAVKLPVDEPIVINGDTLIRAGAIVRGTITEA